MCKCVVKHTPNAICVRQTERSGKKYRMHTPYSQQNHQRRRRQQQQQEPEHHRRNSTHGERALYVRTAPISQAKSQQEKKRHNKYTRASERTGEKLYAIRIDGVYRFWILGTNECSCAHKTPDQIFDYFFFSFNFDRIGSFHIRLNIMSFLRSKMVEKLLYSAQKQKKNTHNSLTRLRKTERRSREITVPALFTH